VFEKEVTTTDTFIRIQLTIAYESEWDYFDVRDMFVSYRVDNSIQDDLNKLSKLNTSIQTINDNVNLLDNKITELYSEEYKLYSLNWDTDAGVLWCPLPSQILTKKKVIIYLLS